ncbi:MAG: glycosyltransferase family 4 protein [Acidimicrobiales bacterium]
MQIHQVLVSASPGDAITNSAFELRDLLRRLGPSEVFARNIHPALADEVVELSKYFLMASLRPREDLLLYHASIGDPEVFGFVIDRPERLVLVYHNISPAEAFAPYEPGFAGLLAAGRRDLALMKDQVVLALCDSAFNAAELIALGYEDVRVSPLIVDPTSLHGVDLDEGTSHHLAERMDGPVLLFVGQILPHKRPELLVQAYHALCTYLIPEAHLVMVGNPRLRRFATAVQQQIVELGLHNAWITGPIPPETLRSFYERADVFVTASDHEGFCVPLLEAMSFEVPIVARAPTAIPATRGGAGLLVDVAAGPLVIAEAWAHVIADQSERERLVARGTARLQDFDPEDARRQVLEHLAPVL